MSAPADAETEWTVLLYGAGQYAGDLMSDGRSRTIATIQSLEEIYPSDRVRVVALAGIENSEESALYEIRYRPQDEGNQISSIQIANWGNRDLSDPEVLRQFVDSATTRYPANRYMLIISGYGDGWRGSCLNEVQASLMSLPEMSQALSTVSLNSDSDSRFDLLMWMAPEMGMAEVAYQFGELAEIVIASSINVPLDHSLSASKWLHDLTLDPTMDAEYLGHWILSRIQYSAQDVQDTLASYSVLRTSAAADLNTSLGAIARALHPLVQTQATDLLELRESIWVPQTDDSQSVDLSALLLALRADPRFSVYDSLMIAVDAAEVALGQMVALNRNSRPDDPRAGVAIYFPVENDQAGLLEYEALSASTHQPEWASFVRALHDRPTYFVELSGTVRLDRSLQAYPLNDVYLMLNTAENGAPVYRYGPRVHLQDTDSSSVKLFDIRFDLATDSLPCNISMLVDLHGNDGLPTTGDLVGNHRQPRPNGSAPKVWSTLHGGDVLDSVIVLVNATIQ